MSVRYFEKKKSVEFRRSQKRKNTIKNIFLEFRFGPETKEEGFGEDTRTCGCIELS